MSLSRATLLTWALLRLPILAAAVLLMRNPLIDWVERRVGVAGITEFAIDYARDTPR